MAISALALRTTTFTTTTAANWELRTASTPRCKILEFSYIVSGTAQSIGLGRPQAQGITPVNVLFQAEDPGDAASTVNASLSWGTSPTVPLIFMRRWNGASTAGTGIVWTFPRGLVVPVSASFVNWNITATAASDINCVIDE